MNNVNLTMRVQTFSVTEPMKIFDFLSPFVNKVDMRNMSEAQTFIALPKFLPDPDETQFRTILRGASLHDVITCWLESIQCVLRTT